MQIKNIVQQQRQFALKWWRQLTESEKETFSKKHFPNWCTNMVSASSLKVQKIWEIENNTN
jgi:murein L,D-transpeptidase YafK